MISVIRNSCRMSVAAISAAGARLGDPSSSPGSAAPDDIKWSKSKFVRLFLEQLEQQRANCAPTLDILHESPQKYCNASTRRPSLLIQKEIFCNGCTNMEERKQSRSARYVHARRSKICCGDKKRSFLLITGEIPNISEFNDTESH